MSQKVVLSMPKFKLEPNALVTSVILVAGLFIGYDIYWRFMLALVNGQLPALVANVPNYILPPTAGANLIDLVVPYDYIGTTFTHYVLGLPVYNTVFGSLVPYHLTFAFYAAVAGAGGYQAASKKRDWWSLIKLLWIIFGVMWYLFLLGNLMGGSDIIVALGQITFLAQSVLAIITIPFVLKRFTLTKKA